MCLGGPPFLMGEEGWTFDHGRGRHRRHALFGSMVQPICIRSTLAPNPTYTGRVTVPVLWDKKTGKTIVSNESSEIIRMFTIPRSTRFTDVDTQDTYPEALRSRRSMRSTQRVYETVNNGVYQIRLCHNAGRL
jgi:putative glutathione S-transferase